MRTIKFRVWIPEKRKMMVDYPLLFSTDIYRPTYLNLMFEKDTEEGYVFMQFTGLKDRNGKEIYGGDILQGVGGLKFQVFDSKGGFSINTFQDELTTGYTSVNALADPQTLGYIECNTEIIGNIYENPDLLTKKTNE